MPDPLNITLQLKFLTSNFQNNYFIQLILNLKQASNKVLQNAYKTIFTINIAGLL